MSYTTFKRCILQMLNLWHSEQEEWSIFSAAGCLNSSVIPVFCHSLFCTQAPYSLFWTQQHYAKAEIKTDLYTVISTLNFTFFLQWRINPTEICKTQLSPTEIEVSLWGLETVKIDFKKWESILEYCFLEASERCVFLKFKVRPQSLHD